MNERAQGLRRSVLRITFGVGLVLAAAYLIFAAWHPGADIRDGRHDLGSNAIWIAHGWLGADEWFINNHKTNELNRYRNPEAVRALAGKLKRHHITDVYPHLCPADPITGQLPPVAENSVEQFLDTFRYFRVFPWIGGPNGSSVLASHPKWRTNFVTSVRQLLARYPAFAGVHLNVEPMTNGDKHFLLLLEELKAALPAGKLLSVAAYPPPTRWHPSLDVHWDQAYFREVSLRSDQMAVMMYDAAQTIPKAYQGLMSDWTTEVLDWSEGKPVLLGLPTYDDSGVEYHYAQVENVTNALLGIHKGLLKKPVPKNYQGTAIYCEWETTDSEWAYFREHFLKRSREEKAGP